MHSTQLGGHNGSVVKNAGDMGLVPESGISLGVGNGNPLQYSSLENHMDTATWWITVLGVTRVRDD